MKNTHINQLQSVSDALTTLATQGNTIGWKVSQVTLIAPDDRAVVFTQDDSTGEIDWVIQSQ